VDGWPFLRISRVSRENSMMEAVVSVPPPLA
jgi:hypothetical protein